jgi:hypothetical protein
MQASVAGFLGGIGMSRSFEDPGTWSQGPSIVPSGSAPVPFDRLDGHRLAGPQGSHPLVGLPAADLLRSSTDGLAGGIELTGPTRVGEGIAGTVRVRATRGIEARSAAVRLIGVLIAEGTRSGRSREADAASANPSGTSTSVANSTVSWVEVHGRVLEEYTFTEPAVPTTLAPGQAVELPFSIPAPRLGPPSAHAGTALVAWAVEARWDIPMRGDQRVAVLVPVGQHPDLLRSGAVTLPAGALFDLVDDQGARLGVDPLPPVAAGSQVTLSVAWPDAPGGRSARVELVTDIKASVSLSSTSVTLPVEHGSLGGTSVVVPLPADMPATLVTDGLTVGHRLRVIVDRPLRPDVIRERAIAAI